MPPSTFKINKRFIDDAVEDKDDDVKNLTSSFRSKISTPTRKDSRVSFGASVPEENVSRRQRFKAALTGKENDTNQSFLKKREAEARLSPSSKKKDESRPKQGFFSLTRRLSGRFGDKRKGFAKSNDAYAPIDDDDEDHATEDDPVMTIFESRNTQRVRWSLGASENGCAEKSGDEKTSSEKSPPGVHIKQFMSRTLFGSKSNKKLEEEIDLEVASVAASLVWESADSPTGPEVIHTKPNQERSTDELMLSFTEDSKARATVVKLLNKARRAEHIHFRYEYAVNSYVKALDVLKKANYPEDHPTALKTVKHLNNAHHVLSSYNSSANIVKMGIKYEDGGELVRALKMYTIAYRIRRDNLNCNHPSLVVLLNMLGSIQIKRGELKEAMQIYELALKDSPVIFDADKELELEQISSSKGNLLAKSVTYREMGTIHERWENIEEALRMYHRSLECVSEWREAVRGGKSSGTLPTETHTNISPQNDISDIQLSRTSQATGGETEGGEMELFLGSGKMGGAADNTYGSFFPAHLDPNRTKRAGPTAIDSRPDLHADMDLALTLHQIAQLHRCQGEFANALEAYEVALRGMRIALGKHHPNVAAILGNIGNLQKEMGDLDAAYLTYEEVLGIESYRLGLSHPDVAITLHNIATIDAARGNYDHALQLYRKVIGLQKNLFGEDHLSVAVTAACMGDVYEKVGEFGNSAQSFEEAVRIKSAALGRHSLDVARLLHKLGKLSFARKDYHLADSFMARAVLIYRLNKIGDRHQWMVDANRDSADIDAALAMGRGFTMEV